MRWLKKVVRQKAKSAAKKQEPVVKTILQVDEKDFDVSNIAADALKAYKSVHKRKVVNEFVVYVKPEESAAYYTVNSEGSENFKVGLQSDDTKSRRSLPQKKGGFFSSKGEKK